MLQDLRYAVRSLSHQKGWTAVVVLSLALGIGANTAIFGAVNGAFLRTLPVEDPAGLVRLRHVGQNDMATGSWEYGFASEPGADRVRTTFSYAVFQQLRAANRTLTELAAGAPMNQVNAVIDGQAELATAYLASGHYFEVLGVEAMLGRTFGPADDDAAAEPVAVISEGFWARRFGRSEDALGSVIRVGNALVTIVGVTPAAFTGVQRVVTEAPDLILPLVLDRHLWAIGDPSRPARMNEPTAWWLQVIGRIRPDVTLPQVAANLEGVFQETARAGMASYLEGLNEELRARSSNQNRTNVPRLVVSSGARGIYDTSSNEVRSMTILGSVVGLILLIVCANVANLLLSRASARQKEISVRLSMGATRWRLIRQLLTESVLLAVIAAAFGVAIAAWGRQLLPGAAGDAPVDWRVLGFAASLAAFTGLLFGTAPALHATAGDVGTALKETSRSVSSRTVLGKSLLVAQIAVSLVLLIAAGLFLRTVGNLQRVDVGFNPENLLIFRLNPGLNGYDPTRTEALYQQVGQRLRALPGVAGVTQSDLPLLSGGSSSTSLYRPGDAGGNSDDRVIYRLRIASDFFDVMGIPLLTGRAFTDRDVDGAPQVAILNEAAVRKYFPDGSPLGRTFGDSPEESAELQVVGVVRDAKYNSVRDAAPPTMYLPYRQGRPPGGMTFEVRMAGDAAQAVNAIRAAVREVDAGVPVMNVTTQVDAIAQRFAQERLFARAGAAFGSLALLVAAIGLFGLMSYSVARRTSEIGIRMALGADRGTVVLMIMRESLVLVAIGMAIGLGAALGSSRLIASQLFGVTPLDVPTFALAMLVMTAVSAAAGYWPARRASHVDPTAALQYE